MFGIKQKLIRIAGVEDVKSMCETNKPDVSVRSPSLIVPFTIGYGVFSVSKSRSRPITIVWSMTLADSQTKFCASMWTKHESDEIQRIARETVPGIKTLAIPQELQVEKGPDAVVEFVKEKWPRLVGN